MFEYFFTYLSKMFNPIITILANETLTGINLVKCKSNVNIVLLFENFKFALMEECPPKLAANAPHNVQDVYDCWIQANNKA